MGTQLKTRIETVRISMKSIKDKVRDKICLPKGEFVKEHKHLIKILGETSREGKKQKRELKHIDK